MNRQNTPPRRSPAGGVAVGVTVILGLAASVGLQVTADMPQPTLMAAHTACPASGASAAL
jgi:hypothetical protein